jgi:hypothetical protein
MLLAQEDANGNNGFGLWELILHNQCLHLVIS